jgi:hypothetical protein
MSCVHIQRLYELCRTHNLRLTSGDLVRAPEEQPAGIVAQYAQCGPAKP